MMMRRRRWRSQDAIEEKKNHFVLPR